MVKMSIKWGYIFIGLLLLGVGICFICFNNALTTLAITIGIILAAFGVVMGALTIADKNRGFYFAVKITFSIICLISGIVTAIFNAETVDVLTSIFCMLLIVDGSFKLNTAVMSKRYSVSGWWIMLTFSVLIIISAFALARYTPQEASTSAIILGIIIILDAIANVFSTVWVAKYESAEKAEMYYEIHKDMDAADK